jgi:hypothetical protein
MRHTKAKRLGAASGAVALCAGLASIALAQGPPQPAPSAEQAALERFCDDPTPCTIINGGADPDATGDDATLVTPGDALADTGKPPSACPAADAAYTDVGLEPDAFIGGCPDRGELPPDSAAKARIGASPAAMAVRGGSR